MTDGRIGYTPPMAWARIHRWLALGLLVPLAVWSVTGLLFHWKPGWDRAYDQLTADRGTVLEPRALVAASELGIAAPRKLELFDTALGPLWRVTTATGRELHDARTGQRRPPLSTAEARSLALDAIARSPHHAAYGEVRAVEEDAAEVRLRFAGGPVVTVGRADARLAQHGPDTERIDGWYRLHYLQWTGHRGVDRALALVGLAWIWAVVAPGMVLFVRVLRRRRRPRAPSPP